MEPKYTWTFEPDSLLLRYYRRVWGLDPTKADFCKLFWSVVLSPIGILIVWPGHTVVARAVVRLADWLNAQNAKPRRPKAAKPPRAPRAPKPERVGPSWPEQFLHGVAYFAAHPAVRLVARVMAWVVMLAAALAVLGGLVWVVVTFTIEVLEIIGIVLAALAIIVGGVWGTGKLEERSKRKPRTKRPPGRLRRGAVKFGHGIITALLFLADGAHAVKSNTCPRIVVKGSEPPASGAPKTATS